MYVHVFVSFDKTRTRVVYYRGERTQSSAEHTKTVPYFVGYSSFFLYLTKIKWAFNSQTWSTRAVRFYCLVFIVLNEIHFIRLVAAQTATIKKQMQFGQPYVTKKIQLCSPKIRFQNQGKKMKQTQLYFVVVSF